LDHGYHDGGTGINFLAVLTALTLITATSMAVSQDNTFRRGWKNEKKLIVVTTPDWNVFQGTLTRYERVNSGWRKVSEPTPVVVGRNGLAWDPRLARGHSDLYPGPIKREGDGRSPAGVFGLNRGTFGFAPSLPGSPMYIPLTSTTECVDDPRSPYYTRIVNRQQFDRVDWNSSEKMRSVAEYRWGVVINYNMDNPVAGDGSCIFLHEWSGFSTGTTGCTAVAGDDIELIVRWLSGDISAALVQLPQSEYQRLRLAWQLPVE
jgi:zinc D-Ala-D-Ala dipeptidase